MNHHNCPLLILKRLRVMRRGKPVYDQLFHEGINIIRGDNGSGKSTIADFIFYILGGDFRGWKDAAMKCDEVQAEVEMSENTLTLRRGISTKPEKLKVFFGPFNEAESHGADSWEHLPARRTNSHQSLSQVLFQALGIPEAQGEGAANITMHQILRVLYSDQVTPAKNLFRFESFDTKSIRKAVGDVICGIGGSELYDMEIRIRDASSDFHKIDIALRSLIQTHSNAPISLIPEQIQGAIENLDSEAESVSREISSADSQPQPDEPEEFVRARNKKKKALDKLLSEIEDQEEVVRELEFEQKDISNFDAYIDETLIKLNSSASIRNAIGSIEFTHCPACLAPLDEESTPEHCRLCGSEPDNENAQSRYAQIRYDLTLQSRETKQLYSEKKKQIQELKSVLRRKKADYRNKIIEYSAQYTSKYSNHDRLLGEKYRRLGQIDTEKSRLLDYMEIAERFQWLSSEKAKLQEFISELSDKLDALEAHAAKRRLSALHSVSRICADLLREDIGRQDEFIAAEHVLVDFESDEFFVDGKNNFAESSNVYFKNSVIFSLLLAALRDREFFHPRFALFDNVEDKGMEVIRSHRFQELLVRKATEPEERFQVIFTTSMMNPALELDDYTIGPKYTKGNRTLNLS